MTRTTIRLTDTQTGAVATRRKIRDPHTAEFRAMLKEMHGRFTLSRLITASGLSIAECARTIFGRDERTLRRWLAGETIPESVTQWMARVSVESDADSVTITVQRG